MEEALEMDSCDNRLDILRYLGNQLNSRELESFYAHLKSCKECRVEMEAEQALSGLLRDSAPLYTAPSALRARVTALLDHEPARCRPFAWLHGILLTTMSRLAQWAPAWSLALLVIILGLIFIPDAVQQVSAASYVAAATAAHRSYLDGNLPLQIQADSPEVVTAWFSGKLPFTFRLPSSQRNLTARPVYTLMGATLVNYKGNNAALVTYNTVRKDPISLLVTSSKLAVVAGGDEVHSGALTFHYHTNEGFKVITWISGSLAYALVSNVSGSPRASCLVCHQSMVDRDVFKAGP
jgi:anti-sigma factor RsiW